MRVTGKVLIVEDNALNLKLFSDVLRAHGFTVDPVPDPREAIARAVNFAPDLVITDIQLPHLSGVELIQRIRADVRLRHVPVMAVTAYAGREDEERVRAAGANAYVTKPIALARFVEEVRALL